MSGFAFLDVGFRRQGKIEQTVGIVERGPEQLSAWKILEGRRYAPFDNHLCRIDGFGKPESGQGRAKGANEKDRLDEIASGLLDGERGEFAVVKRPFRHHPINGYRQLFRDLVDPQRRHRPVATAAVGKQFVGVADRLFSTFDCDIHGQKPKSMLVERGSAATAPGAANTTSTPRG